LLRITQYVGDRQLQHRSRLAQSRRVGFDAQRPTFDAIERRRRDGSEAHHITMERDPELAAAWSVAQLLGSLLPIQVRMSAPGQSHLRWSMTILALVVAVIAAPRSLVGQTLGARPASVAITVVVPSRLGPNDPMTTDGRGTIVRRGATTFDVETLVGLAERAASRIEVRLGAGWSPDSARVMVRNRNGEFEALASDVPVIALDGPPSRADAHSAVQFRIAADRTPATFSIPVEYRITVGASDQVAVWCFPSLIRVGAGR